MGVMMLKKKWSEARLDDLNQKVDDGFNKVDERFNKARDEMNGQFSRLDKKIDRLTYCLLVAAIGYIATHGL